MVNTFLSHLKFFSNLKSDFNPFMSISVRVTPNILDAFTRAQLLFFLIRDGSCVPCASSAILNCKGQNLEPSS